MEKIPGAGLELQLACDDINIPPHEQIEKWAGVALETIGTSNFGLTLRVVDEKEISDLNKEYRGQSTVTNVLSFPFDPIPGIEEFFLGDIVICAAVVEREAGSQGKSSQAHWAHMLIHGILHLSGYDHMVDQEADEMEALEVEILSTLGFSNPYHSDV